MFIFKSSRALLFNTATIAAFFIMISSAQAQVENATETADPARIGQELLSLDDLPELSEQVTVENIALQNAPEGSDDIVFQLESVQIDGVGAYNAQDLDPIYRDKLGTTISLTDIYTIANALTNKYRNDGYILTQVIVPPQTIEGGLVKLRAVEGFIDQIIIEGEASESAIKQIKKYADNLRENNILNAANLERYLLLINDLPGVTARSILSPSKTLTGASDLTIIIERNKYEAEISYNNHGSRFLGPNQLLLSGATNSQFGLNERIAGQFVISGDTRRINELLFGSISYEMPVDRFGSTIRLIGSVTSTEPGHDLDDFDVKGNSKFFSASISRPFIRSRTTNFSGRATFDIRNVNSRNDIEPSRQDNIRSFRLGTTLQFIDTLIGVGINALDLEISKGLDILGSSAQGDSNLTRASGNPEYTKAKLQVQRLQRISPTINLLISGIGQWSATPLLSSEEFGVGGTNIGRGYDSSEIVGDDGISGKIELQWNEPYKIQRLYDYQLFGFLDGGRIWDQDATTIAAKRESIASTGFGIRAELAKETNADFGVAFPLTRIVDAENDRSPRYYISITHKF